MPYRDQLEARVASLEARVAKLEAVKAKADKPPPAAVDTTEAVEGARFAIAALQVLCCVGAALVFVLWMFGAPISRGIWTFVALTFSISPVTLRVIIGAWPWRWDWTKRS
jgi:hypothetical protein